MPSDGPDDFEKQLAQLNGLIDTASPESMRLLMKSVIKTLSAAVATAEKTAADSIRVQTATHVLLADALVLAMRPDPDPDTQGENVLALISRARETLSAMPGATSTDGIVEAFFRPPPGEEPKR